MPAQPVGGRAQLVRFLGVMALTERELARQLEYAARDISRMIERVPEGGSGIGARARRAQMRAVLGQIAVMQTSLWGEAISSTVMAGKRRAIDAGSDAIADLMDLLGPDLMPGVNWRDSFRATARQGINNLLSRNVNGIPLSQSVYKQAALASGRVDRLVDSHIVAGSSAREIAKDVYQFISPRTAGGASYAAMRLGRTELNNAFHTSALKRAGDNPFVQEVEWHLSRSHPKPDECDELDGKRFLPEQAPGKPHPQCFCYVEPVVMDEDEFVRRFHRGEFDEWADSRMEAEERYPETERARATALAQRRVYEGGRFMTLSELPPRSRARYLTAEERKLLRDSGFRG